MKNKFTPEEQAALDEMNEMTEEVRDQVQAHIARIGFQDTLQAKGLRELYRGFIKAIQDDIGIIDIIFMNKRAKMRIMNHMTSFVVGLCALEILEIPKK